MSSSEQTVQTEKAFQKQKQIYLAKTRLLARRVGPKGKKLRYFKSIGLGFQTPKEAIEGTYIDSKCPFTSDISIRGTILKGIVKSHKMNRTIIVRRDYLHYVKKYKRYEKRHKNIPAHLSPCFRVKEGDLVTIGECRPISKTVRFNVIKVEAKTQTQAGSVKTFEKF